MTQIREPTSEKQDRQLHTHHTAIVTVGGGCDEPKGAVSFRTPTLDAMCAHKRRIHPFKAIRPA